MEKWWNGIGGRGKREKPREKPTQTPFRPPRNPHRLLILTLYRFIVHILPNTITYICRPTYFDNL